MSIIHRGTSLHSSHRMASLFISELMMSRAAFRPFFNDTWRRKGGGGRRDLLLIKNNGAPMAPIGYNISQVAFIFIFFTFTT